MPLGFATGSVAGVALEDGNSTPCRALILDGANTKITATGSNQFAASGRVYTQAFEPENGAGAAFGVRIEFLPPDVLNDILEAIMAAIAAGDSFNVTLEDDIHSISADCTLDFSQKAIDYPAQRTNETTVRDLTLRFITV